MPEDGATRPSVEGAAAPGIFQLPAEGRVVRQLQLRAPECREDFNPICQDSPVSQYSRAYLYHLLEVRELLGTNLLVEHNLHVYASFFATIRRHIQQGTLTRFAS